MAHQLVRVAVPVLQLRSAVITDSRPGAPDCRRRTGIHRAETARSGDPRTSAAAHLADPGAADGFGVGGGARPLHAGVQPARALRPRRPRPRRVEPHRPLAAAAGRVLGARGRADGRRRLAAAALADAEYTHGRWRTEIVKKNATAGDDIVAAVAESAVDQGRSRRTSATSNAGRRARGGTAATPSG